MRYPKEKSQKKAWQRKKSPKNFVIYLFYEVKMQNYLSTKIKDYLKPYLKISTKTEKNYLKEMFVWIIKWKKSLLTEIWRKNKKKTLQFVKNISKFLKRWDISKYEIPYFKRVDKKINANSVIIHDETDINKEFSKKMEWLTEVRDWSTWRIVEWYKINGSIWVNREWDYEIVPIFLDIINYISEWFKSEWESLLESIKKMLEYGIWYMNIHIFDRWYDSRWFFEKLFWLWIKFIVRAKMTRWLIFRWEEHNIKAVVATLLSELEKRSKKQIEWFEIEENEIIYEEIYDKELKENKYKMNIVVIKRPKYKTPMVLLTNCKIWEWFYSALDIYEDYLRRWKIESYYKFIKQKFWLEKIQLLEFKVMQKFMFLINLLWDFVFSEYQKKNSKELLWYFDDVKQFFEEKNIVDSPFWMVDYLGDKIEEQERTSLQIYKKKQIYENKKQLSLWFKALDDVCFVE